MTESVPRPAYYATGTAGWRAWWTILHPPYTAWHLSYVVLGAALAPEVDGTRLGATVVAFFLAVGISAHALDELNGRPLRTGVSSWALGSVAVVALAAAAAIGVVGVREVGPWLLGFVAVGVLLVVGYNLELFGGAIHTDAGFAAAWGAFPVLTAYFAQAETIALPAVAGAAAAFGLSWAQRTLSTPARRLRRKVVRAELRVAYADGTETTETRQDVIAPLERTLRALSWSMVALALALAAARFA